MINPKNHKFIVVGFLMFLSGVFSFMSNDIIYAQEERVPASVTVENTPQEPTMQQQAQLKDQKALDFTDLAKTLGQGDFWLVLFATLIAGAFGGVVYELLILQGNIEYPHKPTKGETEEKYPYAIITNMYDLGIFARVIIGALAAIVGLWVINPDTTFSWLAVALVAGSAGTSVFRSMQDRLLAAMAQKDVGDLKRTLQVQSTKLEELKAHLTEQTGTTGKTFELLSEAKGASDPWLE